MGGIQKFLKDIHVRLCEIDCGLDNPSWLGITGPLTSYTIWNDWACGDDWWGRRQTVALSPEVYEPRWGELVWKGRDDAYKYIMEVRVARDEDDIQ
ncbi:MAG: hypothetical protein D3910_22650 [Candidatus Electrothrix sp. ATG2]|nr:hypothetical protein [Candidatus Electrothrix sp. ATG2]